MMTTARGQLVDVTVTRYYHCISRCVRRAMLCGDGFKHRKQWIEDRLELLAGCFSVSVCGFSVMDNHLHALVRLDPEEAEGWSNEDVVRRWITVYPPKSSKGKAIDVTQAWIDHQTKDTNRISQWRKRLADLGWFMKALKEPLARIANKEDDCRGTFWESRFKSIAVLDAEALLTICAYVDLNPVAAGVAATPETSKHTSIRRRVHHVKSMGKLDVLKAAAAGSVAGSKAAGNIEQDLWLCPLEDRRQQGATREGMLEGFSLGSYLLLVDYTSRLCRQGKARVGHEVASILDRLGSNADVWSHRIERLFSKPRLLGSYLKKQKDRHHPWCADALGECLLLFRNTHRVARVAATGFFVVDIGYFGFSQSLNVRICNREETTMRNRLVLVGVFLFMAVRPAAATGPPQASSQSRFFRRRSPQARE